MQAAKFYCLVLLLCIGLTSAQIYTSPFCRTQCANPSNFILRMSEEEGPVDNGDNRAFAWAIVALIQLRLNFRILTPPQVARITGIVGTCIYEAAALAKPSFKSSIGWQMKFPGHVSPEFMDAAIDGAGFFVIRHLFFDTPFFKRIAAQFENFAGLPLSDILSAIDDDVAYNTWISGKKGHHSMLTTRIAARAGADACQKVIDEYTSDGFTPRGDAPDGDPTDYQPFNSPQVIAGITDCDAQINDLGRWQPLCVPNTDDGFGTDDCTPQTFAAPWAGRFTPFALEEGNETTGDRLVGPPPAADSKQFRDEYKEVLTISGNLDDREKVIAEYWADGPDTTQPAGHLWKIAADAGLAEGLSTAETARLLFIVGSALNDAGIASWRTKTTYDFSRPITQIQCSPSREEILQAWKGPYLGVGKLNISEWRPYQSTTFVTPAFAAYTSGHSTFSAAAAEAMKLFFGSDVYRGPNCDRVREGESFFEPRSNAVPGLTDIPNTGPASRGYSPREDVILCWDSFISVALESGRSRLLGGIHIAADDVSGQDLGRRVGHAVFFKDASLFFATEHSVGTTTSKDSSGSTTQTGTTFDDSGVAYPVSKGKSFGKKTTRGKQFN